MTSLFAVTVLGHDRPGIIAATTEGLAGLGLNIEDSTMTLLRGHFAMMLVVDVGDVIRGSVRHREFAGHDRARARQLSSSGEVADERDQASVW